MFIDTHIHEKTYSTDSRASLREIVDQARAIGLGGVCITDHDDDRIKYEARNLSHKLGYLIIPGVEILTHEGDIVVFGVDDLPEYKIHAAELLRWIREAGGVGIAAHPFRNNNRGLGDHIRSLPGLAGIEGFNGNTDRLSNLRSCRLGQELGLPLFGASDSHSRHQVGKYATFFEEAIGNEAEFIAAVRKGAVQPAVYQEGGFRVLNQQGQIREQAALPRRELSMATP